MLRFVRTAAAVAVTLSSPAARAEDNAPAAPVHLAELFVSQSCGNCPGAMRVIADEADHHPGMFVLTWSVDYWDYLGWEDSFARPEFSARQQDYAAALDARGRYTPMLVIDGRMQVAGNKKRKVCALLDQIEATAPQAVAVADLPAGPFSLDVDGATDLKVELVAYRPGRFVFTPPAGSNRAVDMIYTNLVTGTEALKVSKTGEVSGLCEADCVVIASASGAQSPSARIIARIGGE